MSSSTWVAVITAVGALIAAVGGGSIVTTLARRRPTRVEAVVNLNESTFEWAERIEAARQAERAAYEADREQFRADIAEARREAREARTENTATNRIARTVRLELLQAQDDLRACASETARVRAELARVSRVVAAIRNPEMTMTRLRAMLDEEEGVRS